jgi:cytochrome b561
MSRLERRAAAASEYTMYGLMFALPLVGWSMLSAARYPVMLFGSVHLPFILPHDALLYAILRRTHTVLAYLLFLTILAHFGAILFHTLIVRDGMLLRMVPWNVRPREVVRGSGQPTSRSEPVEEYSRRLAEIDPAAPPDAPALRRLWRTGQSGKEE